MKENHHTCNCSGDSGGPLPEWIVDSRESAAGPVFQVSTELTRNEQWEHIKTRICNAFRMNYAVPPGLYAVGEPNEHSDVFVSANYKLSFDLLRRSLHGLNGWILVLDTRGINVWCAAGKGTFGTHELVNRIHETQLATVVVHKWLIVPQLGAPGISAAAVQKRTKFKIMYGPVDASDIPAYIRDDYNALPGMRIVRFSLWERLILTPMELNPALKRFPLFAVVILIVFGLYPCYGVPVYLIGGIVSILLLVVYKLTQWGIV